MSRPSHQLPKTARKTALVFSITAAVLAILACEQHFQATSNKPKTQKQTVVSPEERENPANPPLCGGTHKAARIYFVVDNSNSHFYLSEDGLPQGTDPAINAPSIRGRTEVHTFRQEALYRAVKRTIELDQQAKKLNPDFPGTLFGASYFPLHTGTGQPSDHSTREELAQYVKVTGNGGFFPTHLTDLSSLSVDESNDDELWNTFNFTNKAGGNTPYATGLRAIKENFLPALEEGGDRENIVIFMTDGLPTDPSPSEVRRLRQEIGEGVRLFYISFYSSEDSELRNSGLYQKLREAFLSDSIRWGSEPGNPEGYVQTEQSFERYWQDLLALPQQIADETIQLESALELDGEIDRILSAVQRCQ